MRNLLIPVAVLVLALVARAFLAPLLFSLLGRTIGARAVANQPEQIHMTRTTPAAWRQPEVADRLAAPLIANGFTDAGVFNIPELPGIHVRLLIHRGEGFLGAVYEHPIAGHWAEVATRFADGTSATFSNHAPTGLAPRPGHPVVNSPGTDPGELLVRARAERPRAAWRPMTVDSVASEFQNAYAEAIAYRRDHGVSGKEMERIARIRRAA